MTNDERLTQIKDYLEELHFNFEAVPGFGAAEAEKAIFETYLIDLISKVVLSLCTAWWSINEIIDYFRNRKVLKEMGNKV